MDAAIEDLKADFRRAMRSFPGGVVVVTAGNSEGQYAVTLTAVMSLSMDPPSLVISVNRRTSIFQALEGGAGFCVNVLTTAHQAVAQACASSHQRETRFQSGNFALSAGVPYLTDGQANLFCAQDGRHLYGTHALIIGNVLRATINDIVDPLLYLDGEYLSCRTRNR